MFNEDNDAVEAVETTEVEAAPENDVEVSAEPVEAVEATPVEVEEEIEAPPVFDWNGEVESLREADWIQKLEPDLRKAVMEGIEGKYQNWHRGYTSKFQDLAKQRRDAEERIKEVQEQEEPPPPTYIPPPSTPSSSSSSGSGGY